MSPRHRDRTRPVRPLSCGSKALGSGKRRSRPPSDHRRLRTPCPRGRGWFMEGIRALLVHHQGLERGRASAVDRPAPVSPAGAQRQDRHIQRGTSRSSGAASTCRPSPHVRRKLDPTGRRCPPLRPDADGAGRAIRQLEQAPRHGRRSRYTCRASASDARPRNGDCRRQEEPGRCRGDLLGHAPRPCTSQMSSRASASRLAIASSIHRKHGSPRRSSGSILSTPARGRKRLG